MQFPNDVASFLALLSKLPQQKIAKGVSAVLLIYVAYLAAQFTWLILPQDSNSFNAPRYTYKPQGDESAFKVNIETLSALNLFGNPSAETTVIKEEVQDAPETKLKLTLTGVVASNNKQLSAAIIENSGVQDTYGTGDMISGTRAMLETVMPDRVIIKVSGRLETLMLDGFNYDNSGERVTLNSLSEKKSQRRERQSKTTVIDQRDNEELSEQAENLRETLNADISNLNDYLKILPHRKSGEIVGYSLRPGKDPEFFEASGLKPGDVAIQMNGYDLVDPAEAAQALNALKTEPEVSLLIDRDGDITEIIFSIN